MKPLRQETSQRSKNVIYDVKLESERDATDAKKLAGGVEGVTDVKTDTKENKLTAIGTFDPVDVVKKLRKKFSTVKLVSVEQAEKSGLMKRAGTSGGEPTTGATSGAMKRAGTSKEKTTKGVTSVEGAKKSGKMEGEPDEDQSKEAKLKKAGTSEGKPKKADMGKLENVYDYYNPYLKKP